ncbi:hypothetical protein [Mesonia aestuariivivens]|uniref:DUF4365 domain-containing protein n=1 Tax=Mesonia aestuariivivens TaxID=2796128 RepID=A0ABS6W0J6_9FLAO|nr:hypothetical protein [Mesonia aestuariivivens]MBW2961279.1 hypothetical protein [Mesonia aestuariivivens]
MKYAEIKIKFLGFVNGSNPQLVIVDSINQEENGLRDQFLFKENPTEQYHIQIKANTSDQNQAIKDAFDIYLVGNGPYETDIDSEYVYLYLTVPTEQFYWITYDGLNIEKGIDNSYSPEFSLSLISEPNPRELLNAYNDNVVYIERGGTENINVKFNGQLPITIYPSPVNGEGYYLNLKEAAIPLINENNFLDEIVPNIEEDGYIYQDNSMFLNMSIELIATLEGRQFTEMLRYYFTKSVEQIANFKDSVFHIDNDKYYLLLPKGKIDDIHRVTYYYGYPFDITFFSNLEKTITLKNITTGHEIGGINILQHINRLFFSQGSEDFTINDILPIQTGINRIEMVMDEEKSLMLYVNKKEPVCAPYFKFYRNRGGWGYIRFEKEFTIKNKVKDGKEIKVDYEGIQNTLTRSLTAKESSIEMEFMTEFLEDWEMQNFKDFLKSPRVEMFVGNLFQKQEKDSWIGVKVGSSSLDNKSLKTKRNRERVKIEFQEYSLSL